MCLVECFADEKDTKSRLTMDISGLWWPLGRSRARWKSEMCERRARKRQGESKLTDYHGRASR